MILKAGFFPAFLILVLLNAADDSRPRQAIWVVRTSITTPEKVDRLLKFAELNGYTDLFVQVRGRGDAFYNSRLVPRSNRIPNEFFDPLAAIISGAHAREIRVHAWVNVYMAWSARQLPRDPNHIINRHPDWVETNSRGESDLDLIAGNGRNGREGIYLSPVHPDVREHLLAVFHEIITNYRVDGLHLDYVRFQDRDYGYNRTSRKEFLMRHSVDPITLGNPNGSYWYRMDDTDKEHYWDRWNDFRRDGVTSLVRELRTMIDLEAPGVVLTAAVKPNPKAAQTRYFQDWPTWLRTGLLDAAIPMNYAKEARDFENNLYLIEQENLDTKRIYMGIATYNQTSVQSADKILRAKRSGYPDIVVFSYETYVEDPRYFDALHRALK